ncbi:MAG: hypothetical protein EOM20_11770 [Spartobacteria bacterium]|nr:hypothetical protein [Spartobacteria bacterium]
MDTIKINGVVHEVLEITYESTKTPVWHGVKKPETLVPELIEVVRITTPKAHYTITPLHSELDYELGRKPIELLQMEALANLAPYDWYARYEGGHDCQCCVTHRKLMDTILWNGKELSVTEWEITPKYAVEIKTEAATFTISPAGHPLTGCSVDGLPSEIETNESTDGMYGIEPLPDARSEYLFWKPKPGRRGHFRAKVRGNGYEQAFRGGGRVIVELPKEEHGEAQANAPLQFETKNGKHTVRFDGKPYYFGGKRRAVEDLKYLIQRNALTEEKGIPSVDINNHVNSVTGNCRESNTYISVDFLPAGEESHALYNRIVKHASGKVWLNLS